VGTVDSDELADQLGRIGLIDARAPERFRGEVEPLDARAGHIPGARNRPFAANLQPDGRFKPTAQLQAEWAGFAPQPSTVHQCGSGVTACHNLLALAAAGLPLGRLYPGSWSEWSADPARPLAKA
ncbi:MAG: sulfurtransferase, partial [Inhella sp.]